MVRMSRVSHSTILVGSQSLRKTKKFVILALLFTCITVLLHPKSTKIVYNYWPFAKLKQWDWESDSGGILKASIFIAKRNPVSLDPFNPEVLRFYSLPKEVNCPKEFNKRGDISGVRFQVQNGHHLHQENKLGLSCCYQPFFRNGDENVTHSTTCYPMKNSITVVPQTNNSGTGFVQILCKKKKYDKDVIYRDVLPLAFPITQSAPVENTSTSRLNIAIIGIDAVSRLNFLRHMPLSSNYLLATLNAISLKGYGVVSSGTRTNLVPMLTGLSLRYPLTYFNQSEFAMHCVHKYPYMNQCPFIWKEYSKQGYITSLAEDWSTFNGYWPNAFNDPPTDYYLRPYLAYMDQFHPPRTPAHYCFGANLAFQVILDFFDSVRETAEKVNRPYFQFTWTGRLAHDNMNTLRFGDARLLKTLTKLKTSGALNNTVLMVLGDHGHEQNGYFSTPNGQTEYRYPVAYIVLPSWFSVRYPNQYKNLLHNSKIMTTSFDIFKTLHDLVDLDKFGKHEEQKGRGYSLFQPIPEKRGCLQAGIALKWCPLIYPPVPLETDHPLAIMAAEFIVKMVNKLAKPYSNICATQYFSKVTKAFMLDSRDVFLELCGNKGNTHLGSDLIWEEFNVSCDLVIAHVVNVQLRTKWSHGATFHGEVIMYKKRNSTDVKNNNKPDKMVLTDDVQRIGLFYQTGHCVPEEIKRYCICK